MSYADSPSARMLATHCVTCGRPLVDSVSCEIGQGPECRNGIFPDGVDESDRKLANEHVFHAAIAAQMGAVSKVLEYAELIRMLGFAALAEKVARRFVEGTEKAERSADIVIVEKDGFVHVKTPYRRAAAVEFVEAWRGIPGRRFDRPTKSNIVPMSQKAALWELLRRFFPGKWGVGPKGAFRVPTVAKVPAVQVTSETVVKTTYHQPEFNLA